MIRPTTDDSEVNDYIDYLLDENIELKIKIGEIKRIRSLENEYKELISDIIVACKEMYKKHEFEEDGVTELTSAVIRYVDEFSRSYRVFF
jgi:hypothetical protein